MFSSKRPKFSFNLTIHELSNIPQTSGYCYIELQIRDGKSLRPSLTKLIHGHRPNTDDSPKSKSGDSDTSSQSSLVEGSDGTSSSGSSGNVSTTTSSKKIHNFRCPFNYNLSCNLRFPFKRRDNLIGNKYLLIRVYYVSDIPGHHRGSPSKIETTELGRLEINLTEYLNFKEPLTSKYLLKNAKVNSILNMTIDLKELPSNYDFHTQLQINDAVTHTPNSTVNKSGTKELKRSDTSGSGKFNVPQFDRKNVLRGLSNVLPDNGTSASASSLSEDSGYEEDETSKNESNNAKHTRTVSKSSSNGALNKSKNHKHESKANDNDKGPLIMDPIVTKLYSKILESTWDPELSVLLDYTPEKCIDDIFENPENPVGWNKKLNESYEEWAKEFDDEDENVRQINGLLNEMVYREDLRSWNISVS
ncbi:uncharacterized protein CANTADRAFT_78237 [Suhomyces tanzawaensis NRRL Y-17324]|uniref:C2 NT-type domain-containing protein n=1 Tax=Suhomyces tanzawaensis NRRL Y-17324 TaxID=984487 RepID=A0A1E4SJM9_9ASCO|nr:uncharacterized protein CANTADRAFT_78237 [Suhomyces tanzawaensis NRRL Y-17324]ODV79713.1 hypothetical protein CANTADRAFT_78237 [Suhomyces tanzawaensis NRRL Y-17324]